MLKSGFCLVVALFMSWECFSVSQWRSALDGFARNNAIQAVIWYWYHPFPQLILVPCCLILSMGLSSALAHKSQTSPVTTHASLATISQAPSCVPVSLITHGLVTQLAVLLSSVWNWWDKTIHVWSLPVDETSVPCVMCSVWIATTSMVRLMDGDRLANWTRNWV